MLYSSIRVYRRACAYHTNKPWKETKNPRQIAACLGRFLQAYHISCIRCQYHAYSWKRSTNLPTDLRRMLQTRSVYSCRPNDVASCAFCNVCKCEHRQVWYHFTRRRVRWVLSFALRLFTFQLHSQHFHNCCVAISLAWYRHCRRAKYSFRALFVWGLHSPSSTLSLFSIYSVGGRPWLPRHFSSATRTFLCYVIRLATVNWWHSPMHVIRAY